VTTEPVRTFNVNRMLTASHMQRTYNRTPNTSLHSHSYEYESRYPCVGYTTWHVFQSEMLSPILASASVSASKLWPRTGLGLQQKNQQSRRDWPVCLPTTGYHAMIHVESIVILSQREWEIKLCRFDHNDINSPVCCQSSFTFYS